MAKSKLTPEVRSKIEEIASLDGTVEEMAYLCDVSRQTIYNWLDPTSDFFDKDLAYKVEKLRARPVLLARRTVVEKMTENYPSAMDYLKRKSKKEFGDNLDVTTDGNKLEGVVVLPSKEIDNAGEMETTTEAENSPKE